nr:hypothetical protein [Tanacetum cinerariifolium]
IKSSCVRSKEQCDDLIKKVNLKFAEVSDLNVRLQEKVLVITALKEQLDKLKGKAVSTEVVSLNPIDPKLLKVDVIPVVSKLRKNRTAHIDYIRHTQGEAATLRKIVESERLLSPLNTSLDYACKYIWRIQELLVILKQTCPYLSDIGTKLEIVIPKNTSKQIRQTVQVTKPESITITTLPSTNLESNKPVISSTGVNLASSASGSMSQDNTKNNRIRQTQKRAKKNKVEDHLRTVKSNLNKASVVDSKATSSVLNSVSNVHSNLNCASSNGCFFSDNNDTCMNASTKSKSVKTPTIRKIWKTTGKMFKTVGHIWKPTGRTFTLVGTVCPLTRIATPTIVPPREPIPIVNKTDKPVVTLVYSRKPKSKNVSNIIEPNNSWGSSSSNVASSLSTCRNDHVAKIMGYGDYQIGNVTISRVYYVEGLGHNLFSVGQFCDSDLEVSFRQHTCFIRNLEGVDLLTACDIGKSTKKTHKPKSEDTNQEKLYLLHMDLCGPMLVKSINGTKYILVIVDDYSRFTWVKFLRSKDETPMFIIKFLKMIQQNRVVEKCNRTLIEAARTMLIYAQAPLFLWAEAVATTCYIHNRSIIRLRHGKTPNELLHSKLLDLSFFHVFGALCYPTNDRENLGKLKPKADIRIFIGYAPTKKAFCIYNRRTRRIIETIHVDFDELTAMASEQSSSGPALHDMTPGTIISGLVHTNSPSTPYVPPSRNDWDLLFQSMFDELLNPPLSGVNQAPEAIAPIVEVIPPVNADLTGSSSSTLVEQDAPSTKPKTYKEALTQSCWIEAMQEELHEFKRLE